MSLTSASTVWLLWGVAAAAFAWGVVGRPETGRTRWHPGWVHLRRAGKQTAVVVTMLAAVAGTANAQYEWYSSWRDLGTVVGIGAPAAPVPVVAAGPPTSALPSPSGSASATASTLGAVKLVADPGPKGQYVTVSVPGAVSGLTGSVVIWVPQSYTQPGSSGRHYPVLEVFHGVPGSPQEYVHGMDLGGMVAGLVSARQIGDSILVLPDITPAHVDTECVNGGGSAPAMEDWLTQDVPSWVEHNLRVSSGPQSWATMGLSAGGYCSMMATMLHPQTFGAAIELGGYLTPLFDKSYRPFTSASPSWNRYDLLKVAATHPPVQLWIETSKTDTLSYPGNAKLIASAAAPTQVTADVLPDAGHRMSVWVGVMPTALQWLGATLRGFHP